jgi:hypothetical protein
MYLRSNSHRSSFAQSLDNSRFVRFLIYCCALVGCAFAPVHAAIPAAERNALIELFNSTGGPGWTDRSNWNGPVGTECTWYGVVCTSDRVTSILLINNQLVGNLPTLSGLTALQVFAVSVNRLSGSIPPLDGLIALTDFEASDNQLSGALPSFAALYTLQYFNVRNNRLTGSIPSLVGPFALRTIGVAENRLTGNLPAAPSTLASGRNSLCPNRFVLTPDANWDRATQAPFGPTTHWYDGCVNQRQDIQFQDYPSTVVFPTGEPFTVRATATSDLPVSYSTPTLGVCTVQGATVSIVSLGSCVIAANQAGDEYFRAAAQVTVTVEIVPKLDQNLSFGSQSSQTYRPGGGFALSPRAAALSPYSGNAITYTSSPPAICTILGDIVSMLGAGICEVAADLAGNYLYNAAPQVKQTVTILKADQNLTLRAPTALKVNDIVRLFTFGTGQLSGIPLVLGSTTPSVCTLSGDLLTALSDGDCIVTLNQEGDANWNAAPQQSATISVSKRDQRITFDAQGRQTYRPAGTFSLSPRAVALPPNSANPITYLSTAPRVCGISGEVVTMLAAGSCVIAADLAGDAAYNAAPQVSQTIEVQRGNQALTVGQLPFFRVGETFAAPISSATPNSSNAVTLVSATPSLCTTTGTTVTALAVGVCTLTANQAGDDNWNPANQITVTFNINPLLSISGNTASGTGVASASITGGGPRCTMALQDTAFVAASTAYPAGGNFPHGWFRLKLVGCTPGSTVRVTVAWPSSIAGLYYVKYGPTPAIPNTSQFYQPAALAYSGNTVSFDVTDGGLGDDDLLANGAVLDPSGPLRLNLSDAVPVPTLNPALTAMLLALLVFPGALFIPISRKKRRKIE